MGYSGLPSRITSRSRPGHTTETKKPTWRNTLGLPPRRLTRQRASRENPSCSSISLPISTAPQDASSEAQRTTLVYRPRHERKSDLPQIGRHSAREPRPNRLEATPPAQSCHCCTGRRESAQRRAPSLEQRRDAAALASSGEALRGFFAGRRRTTILADLQSYSVLREK